jgi:hypothetical protein
MTIARYEEQWESSGNHSCLRLVEVVPGSDMVGDWCRADDVDQLEREITRLQLALTQTGNAAKAAWEGKAEAETKAAALLIVVRSCLVDISRVLHVGYEPGMLDDAAEACRNAISPEAKR